MAGISALPRFRLSDASQFNALVSALSAAAGITDDAQVYIRPSEVRFGATDRRIYRDANNLRLQDPTMGDKKLSDLATAEVPPTALWLGDLESGPGSNVSIVANTVYLTPIMPIVEATITGLRKWNGDAIAGNIIAGLYNAAGTRLAQSNSTALSGTEAFQNISFTASYAAAPALYWLAMVFNTTSGNRHGASAWRPTTGKAIAAGGYLLPNPITIPAEFNEALTDGKHPGALAIVSGGIY